jgi:AcrR family transcriptional regulator
MREKANKRRLQSQNTKQIIYEQSTKLFKEKGYYNVSVEEITESLGVSVGAFYHHFSSKDDLVLLWADDLDRNYSDFYNQVKVNPQYQNALNKIRDMIFFCLGTYSFWGREFTAISYSYMMKDPKACARMIDPERSFFKIMHELVEQGKLDGSIRQDLDNTEIVQDIVMVTRGAILDWCISGGSQSITTRSATFVSSFMDGIAIRN